jgi:hypothetical protein
MIGKPIANVLAFAALLAFCMISGPAVAADAPMSGDTEDCIFCHQMTHPGIVEDWKRSRHARTTPAQALKKEEITRRISAKEVPKELMDTSVGCAECHTMNPDSHPDSFDHNDVKVHLTVTPNDCRTCHPEEDDQFKKNLMAWAHKNLTDNSLYRSLMQSVNAPQTFKKTKTELGKSNDLTEADSCLHCHGTKLEVTGTVTRETSQGEMTFPVLKGWPNQGVGRINPDGSKGACSACHSRHQFSIEMARKPYTCSQCHKGPDVPAYPAYSVSKHGNLFSAMNKHWDFNKVPWTVGTDIGGPTCATCHVSLLVDTEGTTIVKRTHQMNDRLPWRILGLIYAHPHTKSPYTAEVKNKNGLPLPTTLDGELAKEFVIDTVEQDKRQQTLQSVCRACHSKNWVDGHWERFENTIHTTNERTKTATQILARAWNIGAADKGNVFDEGIEKKWVEQWLFYANSTRFASAMMGADYGVFANGRWYLAKNIQDMIDLLNLLSATKKKK